MKEQLKRELNKTYLILSSDEEDYEETYEVEMIIKNTLQTILPLHALRIDGKLELFYDVSSKQTLRDCACRTKLSSDTVRSLFKTVDELIREMKEYLLDIEHVVLSLNYIYTKEGRFYFCYCPWEKQEIRVSLRKMLEEILEDLDYHDTAGVELTYHLYQNVCKGDLHIAEILEEHSKEEEKELEVTEPCEDILRTKQEVSEKFLTDGWTEEKEKERKPGILRRILEFFLKKQEPASADQEDIVCQEETYQSFFAVHNPQMGYTQVLQPPDEGTVLLDDMPVGRWKLRPLMPGYEEFCITGDNFLVGKKHDSVDGYIGRDTISRIHSRLFVRQDRLFIADANSTNGTFVNGVSIEPGTDVEIFAGDRILFADVGYECYNSL